jgi:Na+/H+-translocating membrane pyrophosphatase
MAGKASDQHKAAVVGDTVCDRLRHAGPSITYLSSPSMVSIVFPASLRHQLF